MAEGKTVYFAPDGRWFETARECIDYEETCGLRDFIESAGNITTSGAARVAGVVLKRYILTERQEWKDAQKKVEDIGTVEEIEAGEVGE